MVRIMRFRRLDTSSRSFAAPIVCAWMALCGAIHFPSPTLVSDDTSQIRTLIGATWDKPDSKVETGPVVISGHHAVASWTQGSRGGRALLRLEEKGWSVVLCGGDPLKSEISLEQAGVPRSDAERIARDLTAAEDLVSGERRAKFSLFEGSLANDPSGHSQPALHHHKP
jgi:hypothetical protein